MVEVAARLLTEARRIDIYGVGYSSFTAHDAKLKLARLGLVVDAFGDAHLQAMAAATLNKGDAAIGISHSGSTRDVVDALATARKAGATTIAVTNFSPSPITRAADVVLLTAAPESAFGGEVLASRIAQLCVVDVLSVMVATTLGERCLTLIERTSEAVKKACIENPVIKEEIGSRFLYRKTNNHWRSVMRYSHTRAFNFVLAMFLLFSSVAFANGEGFDRRDGDRRGG